MPLATGSRLGAYEIVAAIGAGGMGDVYRARDPRLGRDVAVKVLPEAVADDPGRLARFEREARAVAALSHPNILGIFDLGTADGRIYAVMELLEGQTLRDRLRAGALAPRRAVEIAIPIAKGLAAAHARGLVHRDLKPENIFLLSDGQTKILDFGLARQTTIGTGATETAAPMTEAGAVMGTVGYMAPEQVRGDVVDPRADVFAFGLVLYEMLTGERAFRRPTGAETMTAILNDDPPEMTTVKPDVPAALDRLVRRCLEKTPALRFQSAHDLAFALEQLQGASGSGPVAAIAGASPARRWSRWAAIVAVGVAAFATGLIVDRLLRPAESGASASSVTPSFRALTLELGEESWPSLSPDGASFAYVSRAAGNLDIYVRRLDGRNATDLTSDSPGADTMPAFSPDGRFIAFRSDRMGGGLFVMGATGENVRRLADDGYTPAWSPDGKTIAFSTAPGENPLSIVQSGGLALVDVATGRMRRLPTSDNVTQQPSWSPDGTRLVAWATSSGGARRLVTLAVDGGPPTDVLPTDATSIYLNPLWSRDGWLYFTSGETGAMTFGRIRVSSQGARIGSPQTLVAPTSWAGQASISRDGRTIAYQTVTERYTLLRIPVDLNRATVSGDPVTVLAGALPVDSIAVSPDDSTIVFSSKGSAAPEDLYAIDRDARRVRQLTNDAARDRGPAWSADGSRIYFYTNRRGRYEPWSMNPDGSDARLLVPETNQLDFYYPKATPDGRVMAALDRGNVFIDPKTLAVEDMLPLDDGAGLFFPAAWSPDGTMLAGIDRKRSNDLVIYRPGTRTSDRVSGVGGPVAWITADRLIVGKTPAWGGGLGIFDLRTKTLTPIAGSALAGCKRDVVFAEHNRAMYCMTSTRDADIWLMSLK